jgi:hypothetical protein
MGDRTTRGAMVGGGEVHVARDPIPAAPPLLYVGREDGSPQAALIGNQIS